VSTRSKTPSKAPRKVLGLVAAITAIAVAVPTAYADPSPTPEPTPAPAPAPAPVSPAGPVPTSTKVPDPQGSGCDAYRSKHPAGTPGSIDSMALQTGSEALASNPDLSTFSAAISGKLNPAINIVNVLDGGPYVVFAPTNEAFAKLDAATLNTLKTDPVVLLPTLFYHMVLGYLGPNDVKGKMPTQDGRTVTVAGKGGDVTVNDAKVVCAYTAHGAYIYMIDTVLTPPTPAAEAAESATATTSATSATATTSAATTSAAPSSTETATPSATSATSAAPETASATPTTTTPKAAA
jgi:uncharacterized surface protein with fasciclin (FAS1) repeats